MRRIGVIAINTVRECVRDKIFLNLLIFGALMIGVSILIGDLSIGQKGKFIKDIGLGAISIIGAITAILLSTGLIRREIDRKTIYSVIYRPMPRWNFLLGRYLGICLTIGLNVLIMSLIFFALLSIGRYGIQAGMFKAILMTYMELILIASIGLLLSLLLSSTPSVIFTASIYVAGHMTAELKGMASAAQSGIHRFFLGAIYYIFPNLEALNLRAEAAYGMTIDHLYLLKACLYALAYTVVVLTIAMWWFERGELG